MLTFATREFESCLGRSGSADARVDSLEKSGDWAAQNACATKPANACCVSGRSKFTLQLDFVVAVFSAVIAFRGVTVFLNVSDALVRVTFELRRWISTIGAVGGVVGHAGVHGRLCVGGEKRFLCGHKLQ
jgi:hypothetical protein